MKRIRLCCAAILLLSVIACAPTGDAPAERGVRIDTPDPAVVLAGTLLVPTGADAGPIVLLVSGTGDHVRDQVISGTPTFRAIADGLAAAGVASLRLDVRGAGESTGPKATASTLMERTADMRAALDWLRTEGFGTVGVLGHSAGASIATALAAGDGRAPDFLILLGAPARKGIDVWVAQQAAPFGDEDPALRARVEATLARAATQSMTGADAELLGETARELFALADIDVDDPENAPLLENFVRRMVEPGMRDFLASDPTPALERTTVPTLAIYGSADQLTSVRQNAPSLVDALARAGNDAFTLIVLPEQDHFFLRGEGLPVGEHAFGKMTLAPELTQSIGRWLEGTLARR